MRLVTCIYAYVKALFPKLAFGLREARETCFKSLLRVQSAQQIKPKIGQKMKKMPGRLLETVKPPPFANFGANTYL